MRLHFSIGGYDNRRTARFRQNIHFNITQVLFSDHMHWRTGVDNKISFLKLRVGASRHQFSGDEKNAAFSCSFNLNTFLASFHAASRAPWSCHSLILWTILKFRSVGATLMRCTWTNVTEREILVSNFGMTCNSLSEFHTLDRLRHVSALSENRLLLRHVLKYGTQLPCIRRSTFRWFLSQFLITSFHGFLRSIVTSIDDRFSFMPITFLQCSYCTLVVILFGPFTKLLINLTVCQQLLVL